VLQAALSLVMLWRCWESIDDSASFAMVDFYSSQLFRFADC
jgi:hypothetical protein